MGQIREVKSFRNVCRGMDAFIYFGDGFDCSEFCDFSLRKVRLLLFVELLHQDWIMLGYRASGSGRSFQATLH